MKMSEHEYKVMGMAPYAKDEIMAEPYAVYAETLQNDGLDFKYKVKPKDSYFHFKERFDSCRFDGIAKAIQVRTEELLVKWIENAIDHTGIGNLVFSGGVAMNVKANKRIGEMEKVEDFFVPPSGGDESTAIGAAYLMIAEKLGENEISPISSAYLGHEFGESDVKEALKTANASDSCDIKEKVTSKELAEILAGGGIIARLYGRMEFGARALGNRSILANPKDFDVVRVINEMIKRRDFWMPFTPSILKEREHDYIVNPRNYPAPFMTVGFDSTPLARDELRAAIHPYDFTVRPQLVEKEINPGYWELIKEFEKITGVGAVLNTSFNLHGEPIVASPSDALKTFFDSGLNNLLLNDTLVQKR
jgi:carbamoyltransferase